MPENVGSLMAASPKSYIVLPKLIMTRTFSAFHCGKGIRRALHEEEESIKMGIKVLPRSDFFNDCKVPR
jgi:hypothetical protein